MPLATAYPPTLQPKMQAAEHWQVLANDFAARIASIPNPQNRPIYLVRKDRHSPFTEAFESYLETALVSSGRVIASNPLGARKVDYSVRPVVHGRGHDVYPSTSIPLNAVVGAVDFVVGSYVSPSRAEVIVTLVVADQDQSTHELMREARNFYVRPEDAWHYPSVHLTAGGVGRQFMRRWSRCAWSIPKLGR